MDTAILVRVLGVYVFVSGLFLVLRGKTVPLVLKDFFSHRAVMWLAGFLLIAVGGAIALTNSVQATWVTIIGWAVLLKGVIYILAPEMFMKFTASRFRPFLSLSGILALIVGYILFTL